MNKEFQKDALKVIAILVAFSILYFMPFFNMLVYIVWPIPIVYLIMKHNTEKAFIVIIIAAVINTFFIGVTTGTVLGIYIGVYSVVGFGLIGFILGSALKEEFSPFKSLIMTMLAVLVSNIITIFLRSYIPELSFQQIMQDFINVLEQSDLATDFSVLIDIYISTIRKLYPAMILIPSIVQGALIYYMTIWYLKRQDIKVPQYKHVKYWSFPRWWLSIAIVFTMVFRMNLMYGEITPLNTIYDMISTNILIILSFLLFLQGFAVIIYYLTRIKSKILYILFILSVLFLYYIIALVGLVDLWFNLRKDKT